MLDGNSLSCSFVTRKWNQFAQGMNTKRDCALLHSCSSRALTGQRVIPSFGLTEDAAENGIVLITPEVIFVNERMQAFLRIQYFYQLNLKILFDLQLNTKQMYGFWLYRTAYPQSLWMPWRKSSLILRRCSQILGQTIASTMLGLMACLRDLGLEKT